MIKMSIEERAKQFASFASLRGYSDMVERKKFVKTEKKELTEEKAQILSEKIVKIKKRDIVEIEFYKTDKYVKTEGVVSAIDLTLKSITIVKEKISFEDIWDIKVIGDML